MRLRPDGQQFIFTVDVTSLEATWADVMNLVVGYWAQVGINAQLQPQDRSLLYQRKDANDHECVVWGGDGGLNDAILEMRWYAPVNNESNYGIGWYQWYAKPANPLAAPGEPPEEVQAQLQLVTQLQETVDPAAQAELFQQILDMAAEQFYAIGISLPGPGYGLVKTNIRNLVEPMPAAYLYPTPGPTNPEQYYFE